MDTHKKISLKKKLLIIAFAIIGAISGSLSQASTVLAEETTWGAQLEEAAEIAMITRMMQYCFYKSDTSKDYVTSGWSLFSRLTGKSERFEGGAWLEAMVGENGRVDDGQVYCGESPSKYANTGEYEGSEIIRLFARYVLKDAKGKDGESLKKVIQDQLFCNKDVPGYSGITRLSYDKTGTNAGDAQNTQCLDFEDTYHFPISSDTTWYNGKKVNVGSAYIRQLYEEKQSENRFLPDWDDLVGNGKAGHSNVFNNDKYDYLRYFWMYDELYKAQCFGKEVKGNGVGTGFNGIKTLDYATGEIILKNYDKGNRWNDFTTQLVESDDDWDYTYRAADRATDGSQRHQDDIMAQCTSSYINGYAEAASNKIKELVAEENAIVKQKSDEAWINECTGDAQALYDKTKAAFGIDDSGKGLIATLNLITKRFIDSYNLKYEHPTRGAFLEHLSYGDEAKEALETIKSDPEASITISDESFIAEYVDSLYQAQEAVKLILEAGEPDSKLSEEEELQVKDFLGLLDLSECERIHALGLEGCNGNGLKQLKEEFDRKIEDVKTWFINQNGVIQNKTGECGGIVRTISGPNGSRTVCEGEVLYNTNGEEGLYTIAKNDSEKNDCIFLENFKKGFSEQIGGTLSSTIDIDWETLEKKAEQYKKEFGPQSTVDIDENGGGKSAESCAGSSGALSWILCPVIEKLAGAADWIYDKTLEPQLEISANDLAMPSDGSKGSGTYQAWQYTVGFANILLSILFLFVIFSQLTGYGIDNYGIKKILPKIIVVAVLINLSYIICQLSVDVSNILGANIQNLLENGIEVQNNTGGIEESTTVGSFLGQLLGYAGLGVVGVLTATTIARIQDKGGISALPKMIVSLIVPIAIILVSVLIAVVFFFLLLGVRRAGVIVLIILSPLAIACYVLPNTKKYFTKWLNGFKGLLVLYPICGLVVGASTLVTKIINANSNGGENFITDLLCMFILVYPYFLIPTLVSRTIKAVTSLGDFISGFGNKLRKGSGNALRNSKYLKDAQDRNEANAQENRAKALKNRIDSIDPTKGNRLQRAINRARKEKLIAEQQEAEDKAAAIRDKRYGMLARYRAERDFDKDAGNKGRDYIDAENEAREASKQSEWENRVSGAIFTPERVDYESAKSRAQSRHDAEVTKSFKEQFADMNQKGLEDEFNKILKNNAAVEVDATTGKHRFKNADDVNKLRALGSLLIDKGARKELQDALFNNSTDTTTGLKTATMSALLENSRARNMLADLAGASGSENLKAYAKHLGTHGGTDPVNDPDSLSFEDYISSNKKGKTESLAGYYNETYGEDKDFTSKMDNDDLKFLNSHMKYGEKLSPDLNELMGADTLMKGALTKRGKDLTSLNEMIGHKLGAIANAHGRTSVEDADIRELIEASKMSDAELAALDASTLEAMCDGNWAALRSALGEKRISEIESDPRLWAKFSEETRKNLDPSWHFDFNAADAETKWNEMVAASGSADAVRTKMADQITTLKNSAGWGGLPAAFKDKIDPDWRRSERGERLRDGTASAADHTDIATDAAAAFSSSVSDFESFITKQSGFNNGNIKNLTPAVFSDIAGSTVGTAQYNAAREIFSKMIDSLSFREWGGLDRTLLSAIKPGWQEEFIKQNALSSDSASLGEANNIIRKAMADAFGKSKADYAAAVNNSNLSADELFKIDFSTLKAYASTPSMEADFRTAIDAAVKDLQSDPTRWAQLPTKKRDFLDPAWRGKPGLF